MMPPAIVTLLLLSLASPQQAKREFDRGMRHYHLGEFELALERFKAAYQSEPHADLLFNMAQCYRNLGQNERAIFFFERYVEELPSGNDDEVQALLVELRDRTAVVYDPPPITSTVSRNTYDLSLPYLPPRKDEPLLERWWFWAALFGAVAVTAGGVVMIAAITDPNDGTAPPGFDP